MPSSSFRILPQIAAALLAIGVVACAANDSTLQGGRNTGEIAAAAPMPAAGSERTEFRLGSGDKIRVNVFNAEKLSGEYDIDLSGSIVMPLIGVIPAAGSTPSTLADGVAKRLKDQHFMDDPQVSIQVISTRPFYVLGEVKNPGEYPYRAALTVNGAVAAAGGFTYRADQDYVFIQRYGENKETKIRMSPAIPIYPGDIVRVDNRFF